MGYCQVFVPVQDGDGDPNLVMLAIPPTPEIAERLLSEDSEVRFGVYRELCGAAYRMAEEDGYSPEHVGEG